MSDNIKLTYRARAQLKSSLETLNINTQEMDDLTLHNRMHTEAKKRITQDYVGRTRHISIIKRFFGIFGWSKKRKTGATMNN